VTKTTVMSMVMFTRII